MLLSAFLMSLIAFGGLAITYILAEDEPLLWRLSAGAVIGSAIFGTSAFAIASILGLTAVSVAIAFAIVMLPLLIFLDRGKRNDFRHDWHRAGGKVRGGSFRKFLRLAYYLAFFLLFWAFFERAMYETPQGIFTGGSQNFGDLPFHLGVIYGFADGANFPPENPSFAGAKFSYPFVADLVTSAFMKLGAGIVPALFVQNLTWALALLVILERFVFRLTQNRLVGKLAPPLLFFSGGFGFFVFFADYADQARSFLDFIWHLPGDYTITETFRWGNSLVVLFLTQRSLLLGMPLTIVILGFLWKVFTGGAREPGEDRDRYLYRAFYTGLLAGLLPLIHLHSLAVLFVVTAFLLLIRPKSWRDYVAFGAGVCVIALPELIWSITGTASDAGAFFDWWFGWNKGEQNFFWFWFINTGLAIPLLVAGIVLYFRKSRETVSDVEPPKTKKKHGKHEVPEPLVKAQDLLLFYIPFVFLFIVSNSAKLAPWEWDNIKVLIYWFAASLPFIGFALVWIWTRNAVGKAAATLCFIVLILSGAIDVWRTASGQIKTKVLDSDAVTLSGRIKAVSPPRALFLNAPTFNTAMVLTGRRSFMRYSGHLGSHGIDYRERYAQTEEMFRGGDRASELIRENGIEYVLISPEERNLMSANEAFFSQYPVVAEVGEYKVYKVK